MKELKCPKCGNVFTVDESDYADIVNQVKTKEFQAEVDRRMKTVKSFSSRQTLSRPSSNCRPSNWSLPSSCLPRRTKSPV